MDLRQPPPVKFCPYDLYRFLFPDFSEKEKWSTRPGMPTVICLSHTGSKVRLDKNRHISKGTVRFPFVLQKITLRSYAYKCYDSHTQKAMHKSSHIRCIRQENSQWLITEEIWRTLNCIRCSKLLLWWQHQKTQHCLTLRQFHPHLIFITCLL